MKNNFPICFVLLLINNAAIAEVEDIYVSLSIGYAESNYDAKTQQAVDDALNQIDPFDIKLSIESLGLYWPVKDKPLIHGFVVTNAEEIILYKRQNEQFIETDILMSFQYIYSYSAFYFASSTIGEGIFFRGDVGLARAILIPHNGSKTIDSIGMGGLVGLGYAIPVSDESRITIGANYSAKYLFDDLSQTTSFTLGGLW
jgi:hypothetical protein